MAPGDFPLELLPRILSHLRDDPVLFTYPSHFPTLRNCSLVSSSWLPIAQRQLWSELFFAQGTAQLQRWLEADQSKTRDNYPVHNLVIASRHKESKYWSVETVTKVVQRCKGMREFVLAVPVEYGLPKDFLSLNALQNVTHLTLATPLRAVGTPPHFHLTSLSLLPSFPTPLSFWPTIDTLSSASCACLIPSLQHLSVQDTRQHPLSLPASLIPVARQLQSLAIPAGSHPQQALATRPFLEHCNAGRLSSVFLPSLSHRTALRHLPTSVTHLIIGRYGYMRGLPADERDEMICELAAGVANCLPALRTLGWFVRQREVEGAGLDELKSVCEERGVRLGFVSSA
ncbi:hypothetical protein JCM5296_000154 [Sporobolomyces johnsonii]